MSTRYALACSALVAGVLAAVVLVAGVLVVPAGPGAATVVHPVAGRSLGRAPAMPDCQNPLASLRLRGPLPAPGHMPPGSTMDRIVKQHGYLTVGVLEDTYPLAFRDVNSPTPRPLELEGFDVDIGRDIAQAIFGNSEHVVFRPLPEKDRFAAVSSGRVDLTVAAASITCALREQVDFSTVYYEAGQQVLVDQDSGFTDLGDLGGRRVCTSLGSTSLLNIKNLNVILDPAITQTDCLMKLQLGEVDAVSTDNTILAGLAMQDPSTKVVGPLFTHESYGVVISKESADLVRFVNAVLAQRVEDGRWRISYQKWLAPLDLPASLPAPQYQD